MLSDSAKLSGLMSTKNTNQHRTKGGKRQAIERSIMRLIHLSREGLSNNTIIPSKIHS